MFVLIMEEEKTAGYKLQLYVLEVLIIYYYLAFFVVIACLLSLVFRLHE